jgi:hypothetical protein
LKKKVLREKSTSTKGHYVTNATLLPAVIEAKALGRITDKLVKMLWMIAERYSRKSWFIGYSYREDMVSAAVLNLCHNNNALKFNPDRSPNPNPFSYYTTAINNVFSQFKADEKKQRNIRDALLVEAGSNPSFNFMNGNDDGEPTKESDEIMIRDEKEMTPEDIVVDTTKATELAEAEAAAKLVKTRHPKWAAREPGPVIVYKPSDYDVDPVTGKVTIKEKPPVPLPAAKKKRKSTARASIRSSVKALKKVGAIPAKKKKSPRKGK